MATYTVWFFWGGNNPEFSNVKDALKKAYVLAKQPKNRNGFVRIAKTDRSGIDTNWRQVSYSTLANGKKEVVVMNSDLKRQRIVKSNGELGEAVKNKSIIRNSRHIGDMRYVGKTPDRGKFYNYDTNRWDTYIRKR